MNPLKSPPPPSVFTRASRCSRALLAAAASTVFTAVPASAQIAAWDFTGENTLATSAAEVFTNLDSSSNLTRGSGASASAGNNSFRTVGFQNNGISTSNTDFFQFTLSAATGYTLSLSTIDAKFAGTAGYAASPGVSNQFAYSLDGTNFTFIGSPSVTIGTPATLPQISLAGIPALQNLPATTTVTLRYYASGQTTTGGWGFNSPSSGAYGLAIGGTVTSTSTDPAIVTTSSLTAFSTISGTASTAQSIAVTGAFLTENIAVTAPSDYEVSSDNVTFGNTASLSTTGGTTFVRIKSSASVGSPSGNVSFTSLGATDQTVAVTGSVISETTPTLQLTGTPTAFTANFGSPSTHQSVAVAATNLTENISITSPTGFEVSTDDGTSYSNSGSIVPVNGAVSGSIRIRVAASAPAGAVSGSVALSSSGLNRTVSVAGTVSTPSFTVSFSLASVAENATSTGTVAISAAPSSDLVVNLANSNTGVVSIPATATITAGATSTTFTATPIARATNYTSQSSLITASAANVTSGSATLTITNVDTPPAATVTQISLTSTTSSYTQNFNSLNTANVPAAVSNTAGVLTSLGAVVDNELNGWYTTKLSGSGTSATAIIADNGGANTGSTYSYGPASNPERALGSVASGSNVMGIGALIKNDTASNLTSLKFSFTAEVWRSTGGTNAVQNNVTFGYGKINGTTFTTSNFINASGATALSAMNITGPVPVTTAAALDGNSVANQASYVDVVVPVNLAPGESAFIRWQDADETGNDSAIAIDNMTITGVSGGIAAPEFSIVSGTYLTDQNVKFSNYASYGPGVDVFYTTDGSTPTSSSTLYNDATGIDLIAGDGSVTLKAIAIGASESLVSTGDYILPKDVANLTELRASATGATLYRVTGPATFTGGATFRNTKFFQDSGAGIQIDDNTAKVATIYTAGDSVTNLIGTLSFFEGQLQLAAYHDFGPGTPGTAPTPLSRTLATLTDADQAMLVSITGVIFQNAGSSFGVARTNTLIKDSSLADFTGVHRNIFAVSGTIPSGTNTVTGIVQKLAVSGVQTLTVGARSLSEIVFTGTPSLTLTATKTTLTEGAVPAEDEAQITITRSGSTAEDLVVTLSESQAGALAIDIDGVPTVPDGAIYTYEDLPNTVTIPAGEASALVYGIAKNDTTYNGNRQVTLTATATGLETDTQVFDIVEDETTPTGSTFSGWAAENAGGQGPAGDFDGDGVANGVEYFFGASGSTITVNPGIVGGVISYPYDNTITGVTYKVFTTTNLTSWTDVTASTVVDGGFVKYTLPTGQSKIFVRLEVDVATSPN